VVDPRGRVICESVAEGRDIIVETLDLDDVYSMRAVMPSLKDRHPETYGKFLEPVKE
jgi:predicted amidohydrolase